MTKGIITAVENRAAEYRVRLEFDTSQAQKISDRLKQELIDLVQPILDAEVALIELQNQLNTKAAEVDQVIKDAQVGGPSPPETEKVSALLKELARLNSDKISKEADVQRLKLQRVIAAKAKTQIDNAMAADVFDAQAFFCADYTLDLKPGAEVGVCLIPGENTGATLTIYPAYEETSSDEPARAAKWTAGKFGQLVPPYSMTPEACFYNWAILPGWQRWMPTFRHATITSINKAANTANVDVDVARSSVTKFVSGVGSRGLNVNETAVQPYRMENVPIEYMECDCDAFRVGDRVIVEFTERIVRERITFFDDNIPPRFKSTERIDVPAWKEGNSRIIGFIESPRPCPVFVEHGWLWHEQATAENPALLYPTTEVLAANGDDPSYLDEDIFANSLDPRNYEKAMDSLTITNSDSTRIGLYDSRFRPGNCSGLLRLGVQAQYASKLKNIELINYATPFIGEHLTYGIQFKEDKFYLITITQSSITATKLKLADSVRELSVGKSGDELKKAQCYMLATAKADSPSSTKQFDTIEGETHAYGWKFNPDGTEASIVTTTPVLDNLGRVMYHTGRLYTATIDINESESSDGTVSMSLTVSVQEIESVNYTPGNNRDILMTPNWQENKHEHTIWHGLPKYDVYASDAPIYCHYRDDGTLNVIRFSLEQTLQTCTLTAFNEWSGGVKSCELEEVSSEYECLDDPIKSGFYTDDIDATAEDGSTGYYGNITISGTKDGSSNLQLKSAHQAGWSEDRLCGPRHDWDSEPISFGGRVRETSEGGWRNLYFERVQGGYLHEFESIMIIPFYDCESVYLGTYEKKDVVGDIVDNKKSVTLEKTAESGGSDIAFLTWVEDGGAGNGVSDNSVVLGPDNGPLSRFERSIELSLEHPGGTENNIATLSFTTKDSGEIDELLGRWKAIVDPELFVYRFYDLPVIARRSYSGELLYTGDPTKETAADRTEKSSIFPNEATILSPGEYGGWS